MLDMTELAPDGTTTPEVQAPAPVTEPQVDEVTLWKSRNAGLDAKVTALTKTTQEAQAAAAEANAKLAAYEAKTVGADEALRAQLAAEQQKTAAAENKATLALIQAQFPEAYAELGAAALTMTPDKLTSLEARLQGVSEAPTPRGINAPKNNAPVKPTTLEEAERAFRNVPIPWLPR